MIGSALGELMDDLTDKDMLLVIFIALPLFFICRVCGMIFKIVSGVKIKP